MITMPFGITIVVQQIINIHLMSMLENTIILIYLIFTIKRRLILCWFHASINDSVVGMIGNRSLHYKVP